MTSEQLIEQGKLLRERNAELQARMADQEQVMQALLRSESRYRTLIHRSPDPVFVSRIDDFTFTEVNDRACTDYGYSREEFLTMQIFDIETEAPLRKQVRGFYDTTAVGQVVEVDGVNRRKDGSTFPVHVRFTKLDDEFALAVVRDVTERQYRSLYTKTPAMLHSIDASGRLVEVSERWLEIMGYERSEVLGRQTVEFLTEESRRYAETVTLPQFFKTGYARDIAYQFVKKNGELIDILLSAVIERDAEGRILQCLAVLTNVTARRRAEEALRTSHEQLQVLSRRLIDIQELERSRIARELHDEIGQALTAVKLNLQRIHRTSAESSVSRSVSEGIVIVDNAVEEVRKLALDLRPSLLDDLGLAPALRWYTSRQAERAGIEVTFSADSLAMRPSSDVETACFRVAQEAFTNVVRHAKARGVTVALRWRDEHLELTVGDDGIGFDADAARDRPSTDAHMGLVGMEERVLLIGGSFSIESTPGQGTLVRALFPLRPDRPAAGRPGDPVTRLKADY